MLMLVSKLEVILVRNVLHENYIPLLHSGPGTKSGTYILSTATIRS
jgi:hypothetical protein